MISNFYVQIEKNGTFVSERNSVDFENARAFESNVAFLQKSAIAFQKSELAARYFDYRGLCAADFFDVLKAGGVIGFCNSSPQNLPCIIYGIHNENYELCGVQWRNFNAVDFDAPVDRFRINGTFGVFGAGNLSKNEPCFIVEGLFDYLALIKNGFNALAIIGVSGIETLCKVIAKNPPAAPLIFAFDFDAAKADFSGTDSGLEADKKARAKFAKYNLLEKTKVLRRGLFHNCGNYDFLDYCRKNHLKDSAALFKFDAARARAHCDFLVDIAKNGNAGDFENPPPAAAVAISQYENASGYDFEPAPAPKSAAADSSVEKILLENGGKITLKAGAKFTLASGREITAFQGDKIAIAGLNNGTPFILAGSDSFDLLPGADFTLRGVKIRVENEIQFKSVGACIADLNLEIAQCKAAGAFATPFAELNRLYNGGFQQSELYVLAAPPATGKTAFALQVADFVAASGKKVLYFSLEMAKTALMRRSLARLSYARDYDNGFSTMAIKQGKMPKSLYDSLLIEAGEFWQNEFIVESPFAALSTPQIRDFVDAFCQNYGESPLVIVDYFQIMQAGVQFNNDKQKADAMIFDLKKIATDFHLPLLAISSVNRAAYAKKPAMDALKESGAIEYTADSILILSIFDDAARQYGGDSKKYKIERAKEIAAYFANLKSGQCGDIQLSVVKNRESAAGALKLFFNASKSTFYENHPLLFGADMNANKVDGEAFDAAMADSYLGDMNAPPF